MARRPRVAPGGIAFHAMNRGAGRLKVFDDAGDYHAFEKVLAEARRRIGMRVCSYCLMPNHFHLVLWPRGDGDLSAFMKWLTLTHSQRWHAHRHKAGEGALYQGRFRSFPVREDEHFLKVCRYVERNALRARLVRRAEDWPWCSLHKRERGLSGAAELLDEWPVERPADWVGLANEPQDEAELAALRLSVRRGRPFGPGQWAARLAIRLGLEGTLRPVGRPPKPKISKGAGEGTAQ